MHLVLVSKRLKIDVTYTILKRIFKIRVKGRMSKDVYCFISIQSPEESNFDITCIYQLYITCNFDIYLYWDWYGLLPSKPFYM